MSAFENLSKNQKLRATIHRDTRFICTETCHLLGLEMSKPAMDVIAELVYKKLAVFGTDLEAFAKHAKRQTINADDVKLLVRRNPSLVTHVTVLAGNTTSKEKRRKTVTLPVTKQLETPKSKSDELETPTSVGQKEVVPTTDKSVGRSTTEEVERMMADVDMIDLTFD